jgi:phage repressor protein C with HTH and peptisase S24 domain
MLESGLKNARKSMGLSQNQLAALMVEAGRKVTPQQVSSWERGRFSPGHKNLLSICKILSVNLGSLVDKDESGKFHPVAHSESDLPDEFSLVEKRKGPISAGLGLRPDNDVDFRLAFRNDWLEQFGGAQQLFVVRVEGDSMVPTLQESDTVLINKNANAIGAGGGIFAINWNNMVLVKRLQMNPQTNEIIIKSDNPNYDSMVVKHHEIEIEGKVIWYGRELR